METTRADLLAAEAEAATMREWAETAAKAENENARDLATALDRVREVERERNEARAALAAEHGGYIGGDLS